MSREHGFKVSKQQLKLLKIAHKNTRSKRKSYRLNALILLGQGWTYVDVSEALLLDIKTLRNYVDRYQAGGIPAFLDDNYQTNANKLTEVELELLDQHLQEVTYQKVEEIVNYVESEFDVIYSRSGMNELLRRLDFSYKKPRKVSGKANVEAQKKIVRKYKKIRKKMTKTITCYLLMVCTHIIILW